MNLKSFIPYFCLFLLSACGGGGTSGGGESSDLVTVSGSSSRTVAAKSTLTLTGLDTAAIGETVELNYFAYRNDQPGTEHLLTATNSASSLNFARVMLGELLESDVDDSGLVADIQNAAVFNISEIGLSIRINIEGTPYLYTLACIAGCAGVNFNTDSRTLELIDVTVTPHSSGSASGMLTLNGSLVWAEIDEDTAAPPAEATIDISTIDTGTSDVVLGDILGVWDGSDAEDEYYTIIESDGTFKEYDFLGDAFDMGPSCYEYDEGSIEDLGSGKFLIDGSRVGTVNLSGKVMTVTMPEGMFSMTRTSLTEFDFVPICD